MLPDLPLVGRDAELAFLRDRLARPEGGLLLIAGEAGVGKSRLARTLLAAAAEVPLPAGFGACPGEGETPPFGPWRDAMLMYALSAERSPDALPPPFGVGARAAANHDLALDLANFLATGPRALLVLEDLHWADPASLDLLRHAAARLAMSRVTLLLTYRTNELHREHPLHMLLPALVRAGAERVGLERLSTGAVADLARAAGRPERAGAVYARSGGNPFFARHLLAAEGDALPETIQQAIGERLRRMSPAGLDILKVAAVIGQEFDFGTLQRALDLPAEQVLQALEQAADLHLLREQQDRFAFDHSLVRESLYAATLGPRRQAWHRRVAAAVADPDVAAHHLARSGDPAALPYLRAAGDRALRLGALAQAAAWYERALELAGPGAAAGAVAELRLLAAFACADPDPARAAHHAEQARNAALAAGDAAVAALARLQQGRLLHQRKEPRAVAVIEEAHAELVRLWGDPRLAALQELMHGHPYPAPGAVTPLAYAYMMSGDPARARALVRAAMERAEQAPGSPARGWSTDYLVLAMSHVILDGDLDTGLHYLRSAAEEAAAARQYADAADRLSNLLHVLLYHRGTDRTAIDQVVARIEETWRLARERAGTDPFAGCSPLLDLWFWRGRWDRARAEVDSFRAAGMSPGARSFAHRHWIGVMLDCEQGEFSRARQIAESLVGVRPGDSPPYGLYMTLLYLMTTLARICRMQGDAAAARAWLETLDAWQRGPRPSLFNYGLVLVERAEWHRAAGDRNAARQAAREALAIGETMKSTGTLVEAHRLLGALGGPGAAAHLDRALDLTRATGYPYDIGRVMLERGSRPELQEARAIFARLGAKPMLEQTDALLAPGRPAGLTSREADVARLVARGLSDKEVAAHLHMSPRTVDWHLRNIFNKLDLPSRSALAAWATRQGLT